MVTIGEEPPHYIDQLTINFKFPNALDRLDPNWAQVQSQIGVLRVARLDTRHGETAIAAYLHNEPVAVLKLHDARDSEDAALPWLAVGKTSVVSEYRGKGIMPALIALWIDRSGEPLLSDVRQSREAFRMWTRMACSKGSRLEILVWHDDGSTDPIRCADGAVAPDPAEGGDSTRWLARPRVP